jgi:glycosyltransferase involved in cell wall biosynthesis
MKITVITVCFNAIETLEDTLQSVLTQDYPHIEYIVQDGGSTDGSMELLERYRPMLARLISEPDMGMYDAYNKSLAYATGDVVALLNADDMFATPEILSHVARRFETSQADAVYGDLVYVDRAFANQVMRYWRSGFYRRERFRYGWMPPHPSFFLKRAAYEQYGGFDTRLQSAADYELMLRMLYKHGLSASWLPEVLVRMRTGGKSNASLKSHLVANREDASAWRLNKLSPHPLTFLLKPLRKLPQFLIKP